MKKIWLLITAMALTACTDPAEAQRATAAMGLKDIQITGYRWWGCGKDDSFHTGFTATNASGQTVSGVVCSDLLKGATVRFD